MTNETLGCFILWGRLIQSFRLALFLLLSGFNIRIVLVFSSLHQRQAALLKNPVECPERGTSSLKLEDTENLPVDESNVSTESRMSAGDSDVLPPATAKTWVYGDGGERGLLYRQIFIPMLRVFD